MCGTRSDTIDRAVVLALSDPDKIKTIDWATYTLTALFSSSDRAKLQLSPDTTERCIKLDGCMVFLNLFYLKIKFDFIPPIVKDISILEEQILFDQCALPRHLRVEDQRQDGNVQPTPNYQVIVSAPISTKPGHEEFNHTEPSKNKSHNSMQQSIGQPRWDESIASTQQVTTTSPGWDYNIATTRHTDMPGSSSIANYHINSPSGSPQFDETPGLPVNNESSSISMFKNI